MACSLPLLEEYSIDSLLLHREALPGPSLQASRPRHEEPSGFHQKGTRVLQGRASGGPSGGAGCSSVWRTLGAAAALLLSPGCPESPPDSGQARRVSVRLGWAPYRVPTLTPTTYLIDIKAESSFSPPPSLLPKLEEGSPAFPAFYFIQPLCPSGSSAACSRGRIQLNWSLYIKTPPYSDLRVYKGTAQAVLSVGGTGPSPWTSTRKLIPAAPPAVGVC